MRTTFSPIRWLFAPPTASGAGPTILWWEVRRMPVNLLLGLYGLLCLSISWAAMHYSGVLKPGEQAAESIGMFLAPIAFNLCYTMGWVIDVLSQNPHASPSPHFAPRLLLAGVLFSCSLLTLPALGWVTYVGLQGIGLVQ